MTFKTLAMLGLSTLLVSAVACTTTTTDDDGEGGAGGEGGSTTVATTTVTTGTTTTATTSTGGLACDTGVVDTISSTTCDDCIGCALGDQCADELATFQANPDAAAFIDCIELCMSGDTACFDACEAMYQSANDEYLITLSCAVCVECANNCDAATNCM